MSGCDLDGLGSSSDDEGDDEAEKFIQQTIKNTFMKTNGAKMQSKHENNLLLRAENDLEDDYNSRTPKMISSDDEDENRPANNLPQ